MRAVKAKRLRRRARELSKGLPERQLLARKHNKVIVLPNNKPIQRLELEAYNDPKSTRGIYRALKQGKVA